MIEMPEIGGDLIRRRHTTDRWSGMALFSSDERHRYELSWSWNADLPNLIWIMMNPSTATERELDPTLRRCAKFSQDFGYGSMLILNAYAIRSTDPKRCLAAPDRIGPYNDACIRRHLFSGDDVIVAWGGKLDRSRRYEMHKMVRSHSPMCLRVSSVDGSPYHPLYLPADLRPQPWGAP
jgi:hypothetical protein